MNPKIWLLVVACLFVTHAAARPVPAPVPEPILIEWWLWKKWKHHKDKKKWMKEQEEERQSLQQQEHEQAQQSDAFGNIVCRVSGKSSEECHKLNNPVEAMKVKLIPTPGLVLREHAEDVDA